jgi:hypothetical protein
LRIPPFVEAYSVLKKLDQRDNIKDGKELNKVNPDVIDMCTILAREVIELGRPSCFSVIYILLRKCELKREDKLQ